MEYTVYRDGGTKSFTGYFGIGDRERIEICQDGRMGSDTRGEWFFGYPSGANKLTPKQVKEIVPEIIKQTERDVSWRTKYLEDLKRENEQI